MKEGWKGPIARFSMLACPFGIQSERDYNGYYSDIIKVTKNIKKWQKITKAVMLVVVRKVVLVMIIILRI